MKSGVLFSGILALVFYLKKKRVLDSWEPLPYMISIGERDKVGLVW
jgi:hypothetical protein